MKCPSGPQQETEPAALLRVFSFCCLAMEVYYIDNESNRPTLSKKDKQIKKNLPTKKGLSEKSRREEMIEITPPERSV